MGRHRRARAWLALVAGLGLASGAAALEVPGTRVTLAWDPSGGPVDGYAVLVSRDGGPLRGEATVARPRVTVAGRAGETVRVVVAAIGTVEGVRVASPLSEPSALIRFVGAGPSPGEEDPVPGGDDAPEAPAETRPEEAPADEPAAAPERGADARAPERAGEGGAPERGARRRPESAPPPATGPAPAGPRLAEPARDDRRDRPRGRRDGGGEEAVDAVDALPRLVRGAVTELPTGWEVADAGPFTGDGDADLLLLAPGAEGSDVWVLALSEGRPTAFLPVSGRVAFAGRGPRRDGAASILARSVDGDLAAWAVADGAAVRRWSLRRADARRLLAADLDGDGRQEILHRTEEERLRPGEGRALPLPPLRAGERVVVADVDGDGAEDLLVADPETGSLAAWLGGRHRREAPPLEPGLEALAPVDLDGDGRPEILGLDRAGRIRARGVFGRAGRTVGATEPGARLLAADLDGDGRAELLAARAGALETWWTRGGARRRGGPAASVRGLALRDRPASRAAASSTAPR